MIVGGEGGWVQGSYVVDVYGEAAGVFAGGEGFFELLEGTVGIAVAADEESSAGSFSMC